MSIGIRISELRKKHQLSQGDLANDLGISRQAISKWENDQSCPDALNLIRLAEILDTQIDYLATGRITEPQKPDPPQPITSSPIVINLIDHNSDQPERVIIREVPKRVVVRKKQKLNPSFWIMFAGAFFLIGLIVGMLI